MNLHQRTNIRNIHEYGRTRETKIASNMKNNNTVDHYSGFYAHLLLYCFVLVMFLCGTYRFGQSMRRHKYTKQTDRHFYAQRYASYTTCILVRLIFLMIIIHIIMMIARNSIPLYSIISIQKNMFTS